MRCNDGVRSISEFFLLLPYAFFLFFVKSEKDGDTKVSSSIPAV